MFKNKIDQYYLKTQPHDPTATQGKWMAILLNPVKSVQFLTCATQPPTGCRPRPYYNFGHFLSRVSATYCRAIAKLLADNYTTLYFKPLCTRVYFNSGRKSHPFFLSHISTSQHKWCEELLWSPGFELVARWQHNTTIDYITN